MCSSDLETALMQHGQQTMETLAQISKMGIRLSIDDFGTGYSSLAYLKRFPVHKIKIDRAFVRDLSSRPECLTVIEAIMVIARDLRIDVTVEGVETEQQTRTEAMRDGAFFDGLVQVGSPRCRVYCDVLRVRFLGVLR